MFNFVYRILTPGPRFVLENQGPEHHMERVEARIQNGGFFNEKCDI